MSYQKYREMIFGAEKAALPEGVTTKDFKYKEPQNSWYGTIYLLDGEPMEIAFYTWECSEENFKKGFEEQMAEFDGEWEITGLAGGQGHYNGRLQRKGEQ